MKQSRGSYTSVGYAAFYFVETKISCCLLRDFEIHWMKIQCISPQNCYFPFFPERHILIYFAQSHTENGASDTIKSMLNIFVKRLLCQPVSKNILSFIYLSVLRQVHSLFRSDFATECALLLTPYSSSSRPSYHSFNNTFFKATPTKGVTCPHSLPSFCSK